MGEERGEEEEQGLAGITSKGEGGQIEGEGGENQGEGEGGGAQPRKGGTSQTEGGAEVFADGEGGEKLQGEGGEKFQGQVEGEEFKVGGAQWRGEGGQFEGAAKLDNSNREGE